MGSRGVGSLSDVAQISIKKCASIESDSVLESSSAAKLVSMKLCVSSLIFEEGNVTTDKYHMVTYFIKTLPAALSFNLKQESSDHESS